MVPVPSPEIIAIAFAFIVGITLHEFAHAWAANELGDPTARYAGRLTLNPIAHLDPIGTVLVPALLVLTGSRFIFGWAKPVPINPYNFRDRRRGIILVSLAGPVGNLVIATAAAMLYRLLGPADQSLALVLVWMVFINVFLAFFNLIPVPPLDGSKVLAGLLPGRQEWLIYLEKYGMIILLLLIFTGLVGRLVEFVVLPLAYFLLG
ncbi:MAG TPA: site-2 protease family protein [Desulfotomaculum sp.]|nr:site-2 protease family protein [Desulfotomaculum sp.]